MNSLKALNRYFLCTSSDIVTFPKDRYNTHVKKEATFAVNKKSNKGTIFRKKCYKSLVIRYLISIFSIYLS
jgi:hypothetical protein